MKGPDLPGSPSSTAIFAPAGRTGGASLQLMSVSVMRMCSGRIASPESGVSEVFGGVPWGAQLRSSTVSVRATSPCGRCVVCMKIEYIFPFVRERVSPSQGSPGFLAVFAYSKEAAISRCSLVRDLIH